MSGPTLIVDEKDFRIVRIGDDKDLRYVLEVSDDCDALGVERWREFRLENKHLRELFGYLIRVVTKESGRGHQQSVPQ